jgi:ankyrin repeat protein
MRAARNGNVATVEKLLKAEAKVDGGLVSDDHETPMPTTLLLMTPLLMAATAGHAAVIAVLLKAGAKMNRASARGCTPLFIAVQLGRRAAVSVLIKAGDGIGFSHQSSVINILSLRMLPVTFNLPAILVPPSVELLYSSSDALYLSLCSLVIRSFATNRSFMSCIVHKVLLSGVF